MKSQTPEDKNRLISECSDLNAWKSPTISFAGGKHARKAFQPSIGFQGLAVVLFVFIAKSSYSPPSHFNKWKWRQAASLEAESAHQPMLIIVGNDVKYNYAKVRTVSKLPLGVDAVRYACATLVAGDASVLRWVTAILMEQSEEWETGKRYIPF